MAIPLHRFFKSKLFVVILLLSSFFLDTAIACENDCSNNGQCFGGSCYCRDGHYGDDCSGDLTKEHKNQLIGVQFYLAILFVLIGLISGLALLYGLNSKEQFSLGDSIKNWLFAVFVFICLSQAFYCAIDPTAQWGIMPKVVNAVIYGLHEPLGVCALVAILLHWMDIIHAAIDRLDKEHMFQKINKNYKGKEVTLEDVVHKVKFLSRLRIPFAVFVVFVFVSMMTLTVLIGLDIQPILLDYILQIQLSLYYVILTIGFLIYGRRLVSLMPYEITKKVRKFTFKLTMLSFLILCCLVILVVVGASIHPNSAESILLAFAFSETIIAILCFATIAVFLKWSRNWPFITLSTSKSSHVDKTDTAHNSVHFSSSEMDLTTEMELQGESLNAEVVV